jgi:hypothetical protein
MAHFQMYQPQGIGLMSVTTLKWCGLKLPMSDSVSPADEMDTIWYATTALLEMSRAEAFKFQVKIRNREIMYIYK